MDLFGETKELTVPGINLAEMVRTGAQTLTSRVLPKVSVFSV